MTTDTKHTHPNLLAWRKSLGLRQVDAAKLLRMTVPQYSRMETGHPIRGVRAKAIVEATGVPLEVLVGAL